MKHFTLIEENIDVNPLLEQIEKQPDLWNANDHRKTFAGTPHNEMSDIWVRYNRLDRLCEGRKAFNGEHVPVWYPAWYALPALKPIVFNLMSKVEGEMIGGILITKIPPGYGIAPHIDDSWHVQYYEKFYLSLKSCPGALFLCDHDGVREGLNPKPGELWLFDNRKLHWVENKSSEDRITLIMCIRTEMFGRH